MAETITAAADDEANIIFGATINPDLEGETTALYLLQVLRETPLKITRLAQGLPTGSNIEYADELTLASALKHRK